MMLTISKGLTTYEEIHNVANIVCSTFKVACFAMRFLEDDKEFEEAIREAKDGFRILSKEIIRDNVTIKQH